MSIRWGPGPVFVWEWMRATRRWQMYAARSIFLGLLLIALLVVWANFDSSKIPAARLSEAGEDIYRALIGTQLAFVLLVAPAATASAFCLDKTRGVMLHLMVTDLSNAEIVLGKLFARMAPVLGLVISSLPVLLMVTFLGGIEPEAVISAYLATFGVGILVCTIALTLSVWASKTHEVLLATYIGESIWVLLDPYWNFFPFWNSMAPSWASTYDPFWLVFAGNAGTGECLGRMPELT